MTLVALAAASSCARSSGVAPAGVPAGAPAGTPPGASSGAGALRPAAGEGAEELAATAMPLSLPASPKAALAALKAASSERTVAVFKHSPICPISGAANERFQAWMQGEGTDSQVAHAHIDVLSDKPLARGLVAELGIKHESPQILLFHDGELVWHASHGAITGEALTEQLDNL